MVDLPNLSRRRATTQLADQGKRDARQSLQKSRTLLIRLANIVGSPVGLLLGCFSMVSEAPKPSCFEAGLGCFADGRPASSVFVVGGHIADAGMEADPVVSGPDDGQLVARYGRVGDRFEVRVLGFEVPVEAFDPGLFGVPGRPK